MSPDPVEGGDLAGITAQLRELATTKEGLAGLLDAVIAISGERELPEVLDRIVASARELVGARYGALGVLHESGEYLEQFLTAGLSEEERARLAGTPLPRGRGVLGHLMHHPEPLRVDDIAAHPASAGFPAGHPGMHTLLGVAISVRGTVYGDLYLSERRDGRPFDHEDEATVLALARVAGIAIENARLFSGLRESAEQFQRLLLPTLPDLAPYEGTAVYRPATAPGNVGGDWYDAIPAAGARCAAVIGDVLGHDMRAAAAMAQVRNMLRALAWDPRMPPGAVLGRLDDVVQDLADLPMTTVCLARLEPAAPGFAMRWSSAGHLAPLLVTPGGRTVYLDAEPGLPLGVDPGMDSPEHVRLVPPGATVLFFSDGLVEHPRRSLDSGLSTLAALAGSHAELPLTQLVSALVAQQPGDGHDDMALPGRAAPHRRHGRLTGPRPNSRAGKR